jgi:hypothetical protein
MGGEISAVVTRGKKNETGEDKEGEMLKKKEERGK